MSKRPSTSDVFQTKVTRNDRFAQMSHQEKVIEQKKREIQARIEQKQKTGSNSNSTSDDKSVNVNSSGDFSKQSSSKRKKADIAVFNQFSNDGSFLDQFKQIKGRKLDQKLKSFRCSQDRNNSDDRNKNSRWSNKRRSPSPKIKITRFSDKLIFNEPKINISTCYSNLISQPNFSIQPQLIQPQITITTQNIVGQPLMKTDTIAPPLPPIPVIAFSNPVAQTTSVIAASPVILNIPQSQVLQQSLITPPPALMTTAILTSVSTAPPNLPPSNIITSLIPPVQISTCAATLELATIPAPNTIQIQNIPQPEPINTLNIPPPAPLQVQNIPPPSTIQLNEIPNPMPLDVINIPTPSDSNTIIDNMSDPDFIKNIPPPNKSIPPPSLQDTAINVNMSIPPPNTIHPPPQTQTISVQNILPTQNLVIHSMPPLPPPQIISSQTLMPPAMQNVTLVSHIQNLAPPPPPPAASTISVALTVQNPQTVGVISTSNNIIPSLLAQPVLPPSGMSVTALPVNIHCPPPTVSVVPSFINQPPPMTTQLPPINIPPPVSSICATAVGIRPFMDLSAVCPSGTPEYEAMASLGRMVAECGPGIEEVVRQRKPEDPNLWFLFHKESMAYRQYLQLIEQFKSDVYKPEDIYDPEKASDDYNGVRGKHLGFIKNDYEDDLGHSDFIRRKRKSRWGGKDLTVPPPTVVMATPAPVIPTITSTTTDQIILSQITRNDPALIQYAIVTYGTTNLTEEDWKKAEDSYKVNLVYQDMLKKKDEASRMANAGKNKYDYDSDEDTQGGTWEHKLRVKEMEGTQQWAIDLTSNAEGKHHIGDFLPHDELQRFMEKNMAAKEGRQVELSDYKDFKIKDDNVGFKMLQKLGWVEGQGLGASASGIVEPVNKGTMRDQNQGFGLPNPSNLELNDDEYDAYRKRMMLAYRFRPNPLNNPRRPYY